VRGPTWDEALLAAHRDYLRADAARAAFETLVATAIALPNYEVAPGWHGDIRDFHYNDPVSRERPFAFIVNRSDLLFFVRGPGLRRVAGGYAALKARFESSRENSIGEWTVRIAAKNDAERLNSFLFSVDTLPSVGVPDGITREDVLSALRQLDKGVTHGFGPSLKYDLVHDRGRYPPKAVVGFAAERLAGRVLRPEDFSGGQDSKSTRILRDLGFAIEAKPVEAGVAEPELPEISNHWWVNNGQTFRYEVPGNFLWSPKANQNGARNRTYENMALAAVGDVVFSYADGMIKAIGIVTASAVTEQKPLEFGTTGANWDLQGWRLAVAFTVLETPLRPRDHMDRLAPLLPQRHSPIRATGDGNQGVYLAVVPAAMAAELRRLLLGQVEQVETKFRPHGVIEEDQDPDARADRYVFARTDIGATQKQTIVNARRGQGLFRERVIVLEGKCRVTGLELVDHLRASHIKPWKDSTDFEKLDGNNGLLLAPHVDHLFDQGYISFTDFGDVILSPKCPATLCKAWGVDQSVNVGPFRVAQRGYLAHHRKSVLKK
jgi:putative restriction endonuclease